MDQTRFALAPPTDFDGRVTDITSNEALQHVVVKCKMYYAIELLWNVNVLCNRLGALFSLW